MTRRVWITGIFAVLALAALFLYIGFIWGRITEVPRTTDFWKKFGPPIATFRARLCTLALGGLSRYSAWSTPTPRHAIKANATRNQNAAGKGLFG
jgi:hypothetical protein